jgi:catechol 2,3-dioxygenase-like lactoylglutathione lyase family enzyme
MRLDTRAAVGIHSFNQERRKTRAEPSAGRTSLEGSMISLDGLSHSGFEVESLDRCEEFYTKVLGAKVEWKRPGLMKLYIGSFGLSIPERKPGAPKMDVPFAVHWAYRADPDHALEYVEHVKSCGVEVDGPVGHGNEPQNVSWFFSDPDGHKLEIEAHYPTAEAALAVVESGQSQRKRDLNLYKGTASVEEIKAQARLASKPS